MNYTTSAGRFPWHWLPLALLACVLLGYSLSTEHNPAARCFSSVILLFDLSYVVIATLIRLLHMSENRAAFGIYERYPFGIRERASTMGVFTGSCVAFIAAVFTIKEILLHSHHGGHHNHHHGEETSYLGHIEAHEDISHGFWIQASMAYTVHLLVIYTIKNDAFEHALSVSESNVLQRLLADLSTFLCRLLPIRNLDRMLLPRLNALAVLAHVTFLIGGLTHNYKFAAPFLMTVCVWVTMWPLLERSGRVLLHGVPVHLHGGGQLSRCLNMVSQINGVVGVEDEKFFTLGLGTASQLIISFTVSVTSYADHGKVVAECHRIVNSMVPACRLTVEIKENDVHEH